MTLLPGGGFALPGLHDTQACAGAAPPGNPYNLLVFVLKARHYPLTGVTGTQLFGH